MASRTTDISPDSLAEEDVELLAVTPDVSQHPSEYTGSHDNTSRHPSEDRRVLTRRRVEVNKTLPSCRTNPSTLNRKRKPLSEQILDLREEKKKQRQHRRKHWSCCHRLFYGIKRGIRSRLEEWGESIRWTFRGGCTDCTCSCSIWGRPISEIEGYLGTHISTYFKALVWLLKINLICMVLGLGLIVLPSTYIKSTTNDSTLYNRDSSCYATDLLSGDSKTSRTFNSIIQFFTGTGWMEGTPVFIGWYPPGKIWIFNLSYVYTGVVIAYFILSLVVISSNVSKLFNRSAVETVEFKPYSDLVFKCWDYAIKDDKVSQLRKVTVQKSLKEQLAKDAQLAKRRTIVQGLCVGVWRGFTNLMCLTAMGTFFYVLIKYGRILETGTTHVCKLQAVGPGDRSYVHSKLQHVWDTYSASIIMAVGNTFYPHLFKLVGYLEFYKLQSNRVVVTMVRSLVMKLATICTLLYLMYQEVKLSAVLPPDSDSVDDMVHSISDLNCWENHLAAKIYQLWIVHYIIFFAYTFLKKVLSVILKEVLKIKFDGFDITEEILDLCYKQMIVWSIFPIAPLMTMVAVLETVVVFYIKRWVALGFQARTLVLTSKTVNVVNALFLLSLLSIFTFYGVMISNFSPSRNCTPFRGHDSFSDLFTDMTADLGVVQKYLIEILGSITATVIILVMFSLILYYYKCAGNSKDVKIKLLEERIRMEQKDKAFLLGKITRKSPKREELVESEQTLSLSS